MNPGKHPRSSSSRRALTLIELMLSLAIVSIILLGIQSAMVIASRALPDRVDGDATTMKAAVAVDQLSADLSVASAVTAMTATSIDLTVPDRNGDGTPETIRYAWTGVSGNPLTRTINNGTAATIAANVSEFQLLYDKRSQQRPPSYTESAETVLSSYDGINLLYLGDWDVDDTHFIGEYFVPSLPANAVQWRVTRVYYKARAHGPAASTARIMLRKPNGAAPGVVIEEVPLYESTLSSSYAWQSTSFSKASGLSPGSGLYLAIQFASGVDACDIQYQSILALPVNAAMIKTSNSGSSWSTGLTQSMVYYVLGTYSTTNPVAYDYYLTGVRCTLRQY